MDDPDLMFDFLNGTHAVTAMPQNHITSSAAVASTVFQSSSLFDDLMHSTSNVFADFNSGFGVDTESHYQDEYSKNGGEEGVLATESHNLGLSSNNVHADANSSQSETAVEANNEDQNVKQLEVKSELESQGTAIDSVDYGVPETAIDIVIQNVVSSFSTKCHLNLKTLANKSQNVVYKRQQSVVQMKLRKPHVTASIWASGKVSVTGARSEDEALVAARRVARQIQKAGFIVKFASFRIVNVLGTCAMPFGIHIADFSRENKQNASYEPELHPGVTYRINEPKATAKIFSTGSITVTAPRVSNVQATIEHLYPLVLRFQRNRQEAAALSIPTGLHLLPTSAASKSTQRGPAASAAPAPASAPASAGSAGVLAPPGAARSALDLPAGSGAPTGRTFNLALGESSEDDDNDTDSD